MLKPGSRYSNENDGCATVSGAICPGRSWHKVEFDDGYKNWYQHQDLAKCDEDNQVPECKGNRSTWNAGWGACSTYVEGNVNHLFCSKDISNGLKAEEVCSECQLCESIAQADLEEDPEPCNTRECRRRERMRRREARMELRRARIERRKARREALRQEWAAKFRGSLFI